MHIRLDVCLGCIIAGTVITVLEISTALGGFPKATWEIMGNTIPPLQRGWPFAILGIILLLIGLIITYYSVKKSKIIHARTIKVIFSTTAISMKDNEVEQILCFYSLKVC